MLVQSVPFVQVEIQQRLLLTHHQAHLYTFLSSFGLNCYMISPVTKERAQVNQREQRKSV